MRRSTSWQGLRREMAVSFLFFPATSTFLATSPPSESLAQPTLWWHTVVFFDTGISVLGLWYTKKGWENTVTTFIHCGKSINYQDSFLSNSEGNRTSFSHLLDSLVRGITDEKITIKKRHPMIESFQIRQKYFRLFSLCLRSLFG